MLGKSRDLHWRVRRSTSGYPCPLKVWEHVALRQAEVALEVGKTASLEDRVSKTAGKASDLTAS